VGVRWRGALGAKERASANPGSTEESVSWTWWPMTQVNGHELDERDHLLRYPQYPYHMLCSSLVPSHIYGVVFISLRMNMLCSSLVLSHIYGVIFISPGMNLLLRNCYETCYDLGASGALNHAENCGKVAF
jgi:hypothetical protein